MEEGLLAADGESLLSLSAFALTKRLGEEVTRGLKACFTAAGRRPPAVLEAARRREESIGVDFFRF